MTLETKRLILRPFTAGDAGDVFAYAANPRVGPIAGWPPHKSQAESLEIIQTVFSQPGVFAIQEKETGCVLGSVGFVDRHPAGCFPHCPDNEIGYGLTPACWGRGYVPEAVEAVLAYGFQHLGYHRIWCGHYGGNWRSRRVILKCGFRYQFSVTEQVAILGETRQTFHYMQTREEWAGR